MGSYIIAREVKGGSEGGVRAEGWPKFAIAVYIKICLVWKTAHS